MGTLQVRHSLYTLSSEAAKSPGRLAFSFAIVGLCLYFAAVGTLIWDTNDDLMASLCAAGVLVTAAPTNSLPFHHPLYGSVLSRLYSWLPDTPWHGLFLLFTAVSSVACLNFSVLRITKSRHLAALTFAASTISIFSGLYKIQFTVVAGLAALAGVSLFTCHVIASSDRSAWSLAAATGLLVLAMMTREISALLVLGIAFPALLFLSFTCTSNSVGSKKSHLLFRWALAAVITIAGIQAHERTHYSGQDWQGWWTSNSSLTRFVDYASIEAEGGVLDVFRSNGLNESDYAMIASWQWIDIDRYPPERSAKLVKTIESQPLNHAEKLEGLQRNVKYARKQSRRVWWNYKSVVAIAIVLLVGLFANRRTRLAALLIAVPVFSVVGLLHTFIGRAPPRVLLPILLCGVWLSLIALAARDSNTKVFKKRPNLACRATGLILALMVAACLAKDVTRARRATQQAGEEHRALKSDLDAWRANLPKDAIIYCFGGALPFEVHPPLGSLQDFRGIHGFVWVGGALNQTPTQREYLKTLDLDKAFYLNLARREVYLVSPMTYADGSSYKALKGHYKNLYGIDISLQSAPELPLLKRLIFKRKRALPSSLSPG